MSAVGAARGNSVASAPAGDLFPRIASAVVLAALAVIATWFGGWVAGIIVAAVVAVVNVEWAGVTRDATPFRFLWAGASALAVLALAAGLGVVAAMIVPAAAVAAGVLSRRAWPPIGIAYGAALGFGLLMLRLSTADGMAAVAFVLAIVWGTDTGAFFVGRTFRGAKLWPAISPNKTWSGAIGGFASGVAAGLIVAAVAGVDLSVPLVLVAAALSVASEAGDLFESWVKRRFGAKDASRLVPGHGGMMDRVDGLVAAAAAAVLVAALHSGDTELATRLLRW